MKPPLPLALCVSMALSATTAAADETAPDEHHQLDEIVVTATPLPRSIENLAQPATVLSGDALTRRQSSSIGETLADELGVNSTYFGPIASRPVIRGQFGERVEMLSNGLSALDASALSEDHAVSIDGLLADRVEIIRGPATLLYGSGAAGGIVNVVDSRIHEAPLTTPFSGAVSLGTDSAIGKRSGAFKIDFGNDNVVAHFDYMRTDTDNIEIPGFAESARLRALEELEEPGGEQGEEEEQFGEVENTDSETESAAAAISFFGNAGRVGFSVSRFETNYGIPGGHGHEHEEEEPPGLEAEEEEIIRIDMEQTRYDVDGELYLSGLFESLNFKLALNDYEHVELEGPEVGTLYENRGTDARFELVHRKLGLFEGAIGLQYKRLEFDAVGAEAFVPPSDKEQLSLFAFEEAVLSPTFTLQASARIERQEIDTPDLPDYSGTSFGAALGGIWTLSDTLQLSGNLSITERHPTSTELYANGPHLAVQRFERGSLAPENGIGELDKEQSRNLDLTLRSGFNRFNFSVTAFFNDVSDYVVLLPTAEIEDELQVFDFSQTDAELYGFEAEALFEVYDDLDSHFHVRVFSDLTRGEDTRTNSDLPRLPPLRYGLALHYRTGNLDASVSAVRNDEQDRVAENELPTDAFTMLNAELSYRLPEPSVLMFLKGTNLGDEDARRHSSPLKDLVPLPGRSIVAGVRWDF